MDGRRLRVLVGKPGLDGHDRGARLIAGAFRDAGFEVIYLGLYQAPEQIVASAIEEDVDLIALSILSGGHNTHLPAVSRLLKERKAEDIVLLAGGVIPYDDIPALKRAGVREVFLPGTPTDSIVSWVKEKVAPGHGQLSGFPLAGEGGQEEISGRHPALSLAQRVLDGDRRAAARLMRDIDDRSDSASRELKLLSAHRGTAFVVGVTGLPGAGKSVLIDRMVAAYRQQDLLVGVVTIDPTSPFSGGAILGDRMQMGRHADDAGVFIRSLATRGAQGGVSRAAAEVAGVLDAMGMDVVIIETAGAGLGDFEIASIAQTTLVVTVPGAADDVQAIKGGLLEIGDLLVVNKADRAGAERTTRELAAMLEMRPAAPSGWTARVIRTQGDRGEGVDELISALEAHREYLKVSGTLQRRSSQHTGRLFEEALRERLLEKVVGPLRENGRYREIVEALAAGSIDLVTALEQAERAFS